MDLHKKTRIAGDILSGVFLAMAVGVNFDPKVRLVLENAFGRTRFGLPNLVVVSIATVLLYAPFPWVFRHLMLIICEALRDASPVGALGLIVFLLDIRQFHPELLRSRNIVLGGLSYFVFLAAAWITYAAWLGI